MILPDLRAIVEGAAVEELPLLAGRIAEAEAALRLRLMTPAANGNGHEEKAEADVNLSAQEAARRLGVSRDWLYKVNLPFKVRIGKRVLFSARGLERWNHQRRQS